MWITRENIPVAVGLGYIAYRKWQGYSIEWSTIGTAFLYYGVANATVANQGEGTRSSSSIVRYARTPSKKADSAQGRSPCEEEFI